MTDRRSHWDIDLVDGVGRRLIPRYRSIGYCTDAERHRIYALIEFVEDWMDANDNPLPHVLNECLQWLDAERAAIQRVRDALDRYVVTPYSECSQTDALAARCRRNWQRPSSAPWKETAMTLLERELAKKLADREAAIARVRVMAEAALAAHNELEGTYATVSAKALLRALDGTDD